MVCRVVIPNEMFRILLVLTLQMALAPIGFRYRETLVDGGSLSSCGMTDDL